MIIRRIFFTFLLLLFCVTGWASEPLPTPKIVINGIPNPILKAIEPSLTLLQQKNLGSLSNLALYFLVQENEVAIQKSLEPYGYYDTTLSVTATQKPWVITYQVNLGNPVLVQTVNVIIVGEGKTNPLFQQTILANPIPLNQPLLQSQYTALKTALLNTANENGYLAANFTTHQIQIDLQQHQATINLTLDTGPQYFVGPIQFDQSTPTFSTEFLNRFNPIKPGQPYLYSSLSELQSNLQKSGYFNAVNVSSTPNDSTHKVPVIVKLQPTPGQQYTIGGGYGTDTGPRASLGWQLRHITQTGQYLTSQLQVSPKYSQFLSSYVIPGTNPLRDSTSINAAQSYSNLDAYNQLQTSFGIAHQHQRGDWQYNIGINQYWMHYYTPASPDRTYAKYLMPQATLTFSHPDPEKYWQNGIQSSVQLLGTVANSLTSSTTFYEGIWNFYFAHNLMQSNRFFTSTTLGGMNLSDPELIAPSFRFYAGGADSLRGFSYYTVAPNNSAGEITGGRFLWVTQFNLEQHLYDAISGLVFYDIGNAFNNWQHIQRQDDTGVGLSYDTPVGAIRAYVARSLSIPGIHWQFSVGIGATL